MFGKEIDDVHSTGSSDAVPRGPRERNTSVRGVLYACEWLESDPLNGEFLYVSSRTRALWVPEERLLFQWVLPGGVVQISKRDSFPPSNDVARVALLGEQKVPNPAIREARKHFDRMESVHSKRAAVQIALDRLTREQINSENRVQAALEKGGIRL